MQERGKIPLKKSHPEPTFKVGTGYSRWNRNVYDNYRLTGTPIQVLKTNTKIEVLDDLGGKQRAVFKTKTV